MAKYAISELKDYVVQGEKIYIKGTSVQSANVLFALLYACLPVAGFAYDMSDGLEMKRLYGLPIYENPNGVIVDELEKGDLDIKEEWNMALMLTVIQSRFHYGKVVFIIHEHMSVFWNNLIVTMKLENATTLSVESEMDRIYEFCYEDAEHFIVAIATLDMEEEVAENLKLLGLEETKNILYIHNSFSGNFTSEYKGFDWMLGNTYAPENPFPGFYKYSSFENANEEDAFRIVILGNSATDPFFYRQTSWPEYLTRMFREKGKNCIIWNGGITDYSSANEVMKMIRDVVHLSPDVVISYSGVIDFREYKPGYPFVNMNLKRTTQLWCEKNPKKALVLGVKDERTAFQRWIQNESIMQATSKIVGSRFFAVLQPWIGSGISGSNEYLSEWYYNYWRVEYPEFSDYLRNADEFVKNIKYSSDNIEWLYDFTHIFDAYEPNEIYYDSVHVNETGNQIVAQHMMDLLERL